MAGTVSGFLPVASYQSMADFLRTNPNRIYRYWIYRHSYTPYEQKQCFTDQSRYEQDQAHFGVLRETIKLGDGDLLLGFAEFIDEVSEIYESSAVLAYYRLSDIHMVYIPHDTTDFDPDGCLKRDDGVCSDPMERICFRLQSDGKWIDHSMNEMTLDELENAFCKWDANALRRTCLLLIQAARRAAPKEEERT